ncbi:Transcriptional regulatory protein BasR [Lacunisphaera limnophila]|uniref:Transcriptional regulatory protein BasR n=1 Tax=Lacunisphaera limnophila TaxID=1838286 RepID=A0A1I7PHZ4_9BACT|nr:response regulator [Lacunisphaera limnophila]AOS43245.1 Transcriptional regulatory protein BasR [Lacunisphaera limnophila]
MQPARILIVEDDPIASTLLAGWARHQGAAVTTVGSTAEADTALDTWDFDLIISDVHLPGNDGLVWIEVVLARPQPPPVILITGSPELTTTVRAANLPIAGYLLKPPDFASLSALAQRLVAEHRHRRELRELSRETAWLITQLAGETDPLRDKLLQLSRCLMAEADQNPRLAPQPVHDQPWRAMIADTIATLEKTKHSFRSKELGQLRQRLALALGGRAAA